jgi:hypothetical protein
MEFSKITQSEYYEFKDVNDLNWNIKGNIVKGTDESITIDAIVNIDGMDLGIFRYFKNSEGVISEYYEIPEYFKSDFYNYMNKLVNVSYNYLSM